MYKIKQNIINSHELCILTEPKKHGVVSMCQKNQPISSESMLENLESTIDSLDSIWSKLSQACDVNSKISDIIHDEGDTFFPERDIFDIIDKLDDAISSKIKRIKDLPPIYRLTKSEAIIALEEYGEPENQSPFGAGSVQMSDVIGDI